MLNSLFLLFFLEALSIQSEKAPLAGVIRLADGRPAVGVRVSAMSADPGQGAAAQMALIGLTKTDASGGYRLEELQPGFYYIVAGRVDEPTYYPGVQDLASARSVAVVAGGSRSDLNFAVADGSVKPVPLFASVNIKGRIVFETGPPDTRASTLRLRTGTQATVNYITGFVQATHDLPVDADGRFQVLIAAGQSTMSLAGLPPGYFVKSMTFGAVDLLKERLDTTSQTAVLPEIVIVLAQPQPLSGRIVTDDGSPLPAGPLVISNYSPPSVRAFAVSVAGSFTLRLEPGENLLAITNLPPNYSLKSIRVGGVDYGVGSVRGDSATSGDFVLTITVER